MKKVCYLYHYGDKGPKETKLFNKLFNKKVLNVSMFALTISICYVELLLLRVLMLFENWLLLLVVNIIFKIVKDIFIPFKN